MRNLILVALMAMGTAGCASAQTAPKDTSATIDMSESTNMVYITKSVKMVPTDKPDCYRRTVQYSASLLGADGTIQFRDRGGWYAGPGGVAYDPGTSDPSNGPVTVPVATPDPSYSLVGTGSTPAAAVADLYAKIDKYRATHHE